MKIKALSLYTKILSFFLILLGYQSCDSLDPVDEYGTLSAIYKIKGSVVSADTKLPVTNIRAVMVQKGTAEDEEYNFGDTIYTDSRGVFELEFNSYPQSESFFNLKLDDVDGETNGSFESKTVAVDFNNPQFENGGGKWYKGETVKDVGEIELLPDNNPE